jgi:hypothetical protein
MGDIAIGICLDQSGSMAGAKQQETIDGFNAFKEEQVAQPGSAYLTLVVFDTGHVVRFRGGDLKLVDDLGKGVNPYSPSGGTALYDAVDTTITEMESFLADNAGFGGQIVVAIFTDGCENSSRRVNIEALNDRIRAKKEDGWEFAFLGAGGASWTEGRSFAAAGVSTLNYDASIPGNTQQAYSVFAASVTTTRATGQSLGTTFTNSVAPLQADPDLKAQDPDQQ